MTTEKCLQNGAYVKNVHLIQTTSVRFNLKIIIILTFRLLNSADKRNVRPNSEIYLHQAAICTYNAIQNECSHECQFLSSFWKSFSSLIKSIIKINFS